VEMGMEEGGGREGGWRPSRPCNASKFRGLASESRDIHRWHLVGSGIVKECPVHVLAHEPLLPPIPPIHPLVGVHTRTSRERKREGETEGERAVWRERERERERGRESVCV